MNRIARLPLSPALGALLFAITVYFSAGVAYAQTVWPNQPINVIVVFNPGGGTDLMARALAPYLEKYLGGDARIVVLNRPGASGAIGFAELARAKPDGYTLGFLNTPQLITIPIERQVSFHWTDYELLGTVVDDPSSFAVNTRLSDIKTPAELADFIHANTGQVTVGTTGVGSDDHLAALLFWQQIGAPPPIYVHYKGSSALRTAILSGEVDIAAMNVSEIAAFAQSGSPLRSLGAMTAARASIAPEVPTFGEQGYEVIMSSLRGLAAPKGLPEAVRTKLVVALEAAVRDPEFLAKAHAMFLPMHYLPPAQYQTVVQTQENMLRDFWQKLPWADN